MASEMSDQQVGQHLATRRNFRLCRAIHDTSDITGQWIMQGWHNVIESLLVIRRTCKKCCCLVGDRRAMPVPAFPQ